MKLTNHLGRYGQLIVAAIGVAAIAGGVATTSIIVGASHPSPTPSASPASSPTPSPTPWTAATVFRDVSTANSFSIELQGGRPDTGQFDYSVAGQGDYIGTATLSSEGASGNVKLTGSVSALFVPPSGEPLSHVPVRLEGQVLDDGSTLTLEIWVNGVHAHLATGNSAPAQAGTIAQEAVSALGSQDWATLYSLLAPEVQSSLGSEQAFATAVSAQDGQILSASLTGSPTTSSSNGYSYFSQGVSLTVSTSSGTAAYTTTIYLEYEGGQWLVLGTDPPSPA